VAGPQPHHALVLTLLAVAFVAGIATFLSPCVLPVLPVIAVGAIGGGRARAVALTVGLVASFTVFTLLASRLLDALGLPADALRNVAIAILAVVGVALLLPRLGELAGRPFTRLAALGGPLTRQREGIGGGLVLGVGLGLVWTPCAGPILAAVTALAAERRLSLDAAFVTFTYALGAGLPLLVIALAGRRALTGLRATRVHAQAVRRASGLVMIGAAVLFTTAIPTELATAAPGLTSSLQKVERSSDAAKHIAQLTHARTTFTKPAETASRATSLRDFGPAPQFAGLSTWLNTGGKALSMTGLRGKVVLVDFWTYSCINCIRTLPYLKSWDARYRARGLVIVGVHTPEFAFEHVVSNVRQAVHEQGIHYPVAIDNDYGTWQAYGNQYWPAHYLIDRRGHVREVHFGEGQYAQTERDIQQLLGEPAATALASTRVRAVTPSGDVGTPETYLGSERGEYAQKITKNVMRRYVEPAETNANEVTLQGDWKVGAQYLTAGPGASIRLSYTARRAYLVFGAPKDGKVASVRVSVTGAPVRTVKVDHDDLYNVASIPGPSSLRTLVAHVPPGVRAYSFTFG
jgi:cytochrome c biogenesis protein CcdA/thiol-disulfide isomerase/thioredoxin